MVLQTKDTDKKMECDIVTNFERNDRVLLDICPKGGPSDTIRVKIELVINNVSEVL